MASKSIREEIEGIFAKAELLDNVVIEKLRDLIKKIQGERDTFREENKRLTEENDRLNYENGMNFFHIYFFYTQKILVVSIKRHVI